MNTYDAIAGNDLVPLRPVAKGVQPLPVPTSSIVAVGRRAPLWLEVSVRAFVGVDAAKGETGGETSAGLFSRSFGWWQPQRLGQ